MFDTIHPVTAHFAVALPLVALILGIIYLIKREEALSRASTMVLVFGALGMIAAWYTGGSDMNPDILMSLSDDAKSLLTEHKQMGLYTMIAVVVAAAIKFVGCQTKKFGLEALAIVILLGAGGLTVYQGKMGGDLVYTYGVGVDKHLDGLGCLEDPEMYIEEEAPDSDN